MARILVADDEETVLSLIRRVLEGAGHQVVTAADGNEALKLALSKTFDFYIIDVKMPLLDGFSLARAITKRFPARKVVLITALDRPKYEILGNISGAAAIIAKPFDGPQFMSQIAPFLP
ncbi:MAG: response regulator [Elusimicrobia bacterium]|nr:response regulator [Elusimicrobiota bacterium]